MVTGIGIDIIEIDRVEKLLKEYGEKFLNKVFTQREIEYCNSKAKPSQHFAARFAAKEAIAKALGTGLGSELKIKDIEIINDDRGKPHIVPIGNQKNLLVSISHSEHYVVAVAIKNE